MVKIGIAGGVILGANKLFKMKTISDKMVSNLSNPRIHKVDFSRISFRTEIKIQNPTNNSMSITKPVVTLTPKGKYITSTSPEQKDFIIQSLTTTTIDTIYGRKAYRKMHRRVKELVTSGVQVICLLALNDD